MSEFTKGPWKAIMQRQTTTNEPIGFYIEAPAPRGGRIGWVDRAYGDTNLHAGYENAENIANANLIAAAPEMLEALKIAQSQLRHLTDSLYDAGKEKINVAIAKAEGK